MDPIEGFIKQLHDKLPDQYKPIAEAALEVYSTRGKLTPKQHAWVLNTARFQRVAVPPEFAEVEVFNKVQPQPDQEPTEPTEPDAEAPEIEDPAEFMANRLLKTAEILIRAAEELKALD
jgi:hypothetical protein